MASVKHALSAGERSRVPAVSPRTVTQEGSTLSMVRHARAHVFFSPALFFSEQNTNASLNLKMGIFFFYYSYLISAVGCKQGGGGSRKTGA